MVLRLVSPEQSQRNTKHKSGKHRPSTAPLLSQLHGWPPFSTRGQQHTYKSKGNPTRGFGAALLTQPRGGTKAHECLMLQQGAVVHMPTKPIVCSANRHNNSLGLFLPTGASDAQT